MVLRLVGVLNFILVLFGPLNIQGRESYLYDFIKKKKTTTKKTLTCIETFRTDYFQAWYGDRDYEALQFGIRLDDLVLHSESQGLDVS